MAKLVLLSGDAPVEHELGEDTTLGRHVENTIQISDRAVSKKHAVIRRVGENCYLLRDQGSTNGTFIAGRRVDEHQLVDGEEVVFGNTRFVFRDDLAGEKGVSLQSVVFMPEGEEGPSTIEKMRVEREGVARFRPEREIADEDSLRSDYERLRIAYELSGTIGSELDLDRLLHKILERAFELLPADRGVILLLDEQGTLAPRMAERRGGGSLDEIAISTNITLEVMDQQKAILSADAMVDSRFAGAQSIAIEGIRSTMCVPLVHADEIYGLMYLDTQVETNAFSEKDLQIFTSIASQAAVAVANAQLAARNEWEAQARARFQRFFSPDLVEQLIDGKLQLEGVGEEREVTCLFADIRGFTAMSENADAHEIVRLLNDYFEIMVDVLFQNNGTLDKYVGDEIMALFGVPVAQPDAALDAVACGVAMQEALAVYNDKITAEGRKPVKVGIGINTGPCVYGALGSSKTLQYTVIGDSVNTASRLCSVAKGDEVIISQDTYDQVADRIEAEALPKVRVKGKQDELSIYRVIRVKPPESHDRTTQLPRLQM